MFIKRILLGSLAAFVTSTAVLAQPSGAEGEDFIYRVQAGDTLSAIAELYTIQTINWPHLQTLNNVTDPYALPIGKNLRIPFSMIPTHDAKTTVTHLNGSPKINNRDVQIGDELKEGDVISTDERSFITLTLVDDSTLSVPPNSLLTLQRIKAFVRAGISDSIIKLDTGNVETRVAPNQQGVGRFEVHSPVAITGVRGTDLRVRAFSDKTITEVISGQAKLQAPGATPQMILANRGAAIGRDGELFGRANLLPAPTFSELTRHGSSWQVSFPAVTGAQQYLAQVSLDELGTQLVSRQLTTDTTLQFQASRSGTHYLRVRAIDANGIMGIDAVVSFPGRPSLHTSDGSAVLTRFGTPVTLRSF